MTKQFKDTIFKYDVLFEEAAEGGYTVFAPALPGCLSEGDTFEEAKRNIKDAIVLYLESLAADNQPVFSSGKTFLGSVEVNFQGQRNASVASCERILC